MTKKAAKKFQVQLVDTILLVVTLVLTVLAFAGLALNFISRKGSVPINQTENYTNIETWNLGVWFMNITDMRNYDHIAGWQIARWTLVATAILLVVLLVLLVLRYFVKHPAVHWTIAGVGLVAIIGALLFLLSTITGCQALAVQIENSTVTYQPRSGVFVFGLSALVAAVLTEVMVWLPKIVKPQKNKKTVAKR